MPRIEIPGWYGKSVRNRLKPSLEAGGGSASPFERTFDSSLNFSSRRPPRWAGNQSAWVQAGPVEVSKVTKYYPFGASRVAMRQGGVVYYLHGDHLGSTSLTTNQSGGLVSQARYLPYGEERWTNGASPTDFAFTSQRKDGFGLYDYNARFYSPLLGRFISPDTVVPEPLNSQEWNRYSYVTNNPLRFKDPTGHKQESGAGFGASRDVYLILAHQYEQKAAAAGDSWRGTLNEYYSTVAAKNYSLAEGNLINARTLEDIIQGPLYTRLATSGYFGAEEQVNAAAEAAGGDLTEASLNTLGGLGTAGALYRGLAKGENIEAGLFARSPDAGDPPASHVAGKRDSQWISTTKDPDVAINKYGEHGVVEIDVSKVDTEIVDLSEGIPDMPMLSSWAKKDQEVLVKNYIPPEALKRIK